MDIKRAAEGNSRNKVIIFSMIIIAFICGNGVIAEDRISLPLINISFTNEYFIYFGLIFWWAFEYWRFKQSDKYVFEGKLIDYANSKSFFVYYLVPFLKDIKAKGWNSKCNISTYFHANFIYKAQLRGMGGPSDMRVNVDELTDILNQSDFKIVEIELVKSKQRGRGENIIEQVNISFDLKNDREGRQYIKKMKKEYKTKSPEFISDRLPDYLFYITCYTITLKIIIGFMI